MDNIDRLVIVFFCLTILWVVNTTEQKINAIGNTLQQLETQQRGG